MKPAKSCSKEGSNHDAGGAFTLPELLVVLAVLTLLVVIQVSAVGHNRRGVDQTICSNNLKQLISAWQMYADDNRGVCVLNSGHGTTGPQFPPYNDWVAGILTSFSGNTDNTNTFNLTNSSRAAIAPYLSQPSAALFRCPADPSVDLAYGPRVRSYSMNAVMGAGSGSKEQLLSSGSASGWLYVRVPQIKNPSSKFVLLEENKSTINDAVFFTDLGSGGPAGPIDVTSGTLFKDALASYHNFGTSFGFADGHYELHKWKAVATITMTGINTPVATSREDFNWLARHTYEK